MAKNILPFHDFANPLAHMARDSSIPWPQSRSAAAAVVSPLALHPELLLARIGQ
jgi:hypothetical protein